MAVGGLRTGRANYSGTPTKAKTPTHYTGIELELLSAKTVAKFIINC